ncbi:MAG TPA: hypothetical protein VGI56_12675 [Galbitalea sp.]
MALSDELSKLASQTKALEDSAESVKTRNDAQVQARIDQLHASLDSAKEEFEDDVTVANDKAAANWSAMQKKVSDHFDALHAKVAARNAGREAKHAERIADESELDAADAVDFASYAIQEAEYAVLQATLDRAAADAVAE